MSFPKDKDQEQILDSFQPQYYPILASSIQQINNSIKDNADPTDAAENLLTDLPFEWLGEIQDKIDHYKAVYENIVIAQEPLFKRGTPGSQKSAGRAAILQAKFDYARAVKQTVISLIAVKFKLYHTRKPVESGSHIFPEYINDGDDD